MTNDTETLRFRTRWLHNTVKVLKTSCDNYHNDTVRKIEQMVAAKRGHDKQALAE